MSKSKNGRIKLLSVGVADYSGSSFSGLPSATKDAREVFSAFSSVLGGLLIQESSLVAIDTTAEEYIALLRVLLRHCQERELIVLFFSGHAVINDETLELLFAKGATVSVADIDELFRRAGRPETLAILDCCFAGLAGTLSQSHSSYFPKRTSVLASSGVAQRTSLAGILSPFTEALVKALHRLDEKGSPLSLLSLHAETLRLFPNTLEHQPCAFIRAGLSDLVVRETTQVLDSDDNFARQYIEALSTVPAHDRETLWYSLDHFHEGIKLKIVSDVLARYPGEPLWLVRRACGSVLGNIRHLKAEAEHLTNRLLQSKRWMDVCIGLIAGRSSVLDGNLASLYQQVSMSHHPMDAKWLAFLYLADAHKATLLRYLDLDASGLAKSGWGACELWERGSEGLSQDEKQTLLERIFGASDEPARGELINCLFLAYEDIFEKLQRDMWAKVTPEITKDPVLKQICATPQRGRIRDANVPKWVYSRLYGSWRGHKLLELVDLIRNIPKQQLIHTLATAKLLPVVPARMGIFEALRHFDDLPSGIPDALAWGFSDPHPWVRRSALEWLTAHAQSIEQREEFLNATRLDCDKAILPGSLDLLFAFIKVAKSVGWTSEKIQSCTKEITAGLSVEERNSIAHACSNEGL